MAVIDVAQAALVAERADVALDVVLSEGIDGLVARCRSWNSRWMPRRGSCRTHRLAVTSAISRSSPRCGPGSTLCPGQRRTGCLRESASTHRQEECAGLRRPYRYRTEAAEGRICRTPSGRTDAHPYTGIAWFSRQCKAR